VATSLVCNIRERVLVCVSTYPNALQLIRRAYRLANYMHAPLYGLYVEDPDRFLSKQESLHIESCKHLLNEFGGEFLRLADYNKAKTIAVTAHQHRITQIVIGETQQPRWKIFLKGSLIQELLKSLKDIDIHIIATSNK